MFQGFVGFFGLKLSILEGISPCCERFYSDDYFFIFTLRVWCFPFPGCFLFPEWCFFLSLKRQDGSSVIMKVSEIRTFIRKNRAQLFDDHSEIEPVKTHTFSLATKTEARQRAAKLRWDNLELSYCRHEQWRNSRHPAHKFDAHFYPTGDLQNEGYHACPEEQKPSLEGPIHWYGGALFLFA